MKVAVLGFGSQGSSSVEYWQKLGHEITVCDHNESLEGPDGVDLQIGEGYLNDLDRFDLIVRSPSIHPSDITKANPLALTIQSKVTTNTNEFLRVCPTSNIIGVTGTKGKGTTSTLITRMLEAADFPVHLGGNIGIPPLEMLKDGIKSDDWVVLELANFQLIDLEISPPVAVCLMVEPEHMDWHSSVNEYITAKQQLFRWQKDTDTAIFYAANTLSRQIVSASQGTKIPYFEEPGAIIKDGQVMIADQVICETKDIKLHGEHNWQNVCAALTAVWQITQDVDILRGAIRDFSGLPYRLEFIREVSEVQYYNDSFGTTPETAIVAIKAFDSPKVIILGGSDKGADYSELAKTVVENNVRAVVTIGDTGPAIAGQLRKHGFDKIISGGDKMPDIVAAARRETQPRDIVLLSTASASFGLFDNYKDRGDQFNQAVRALA